MTQDKIEKVAQEHWKWIEGLWESLPDGGTFGLTTTKYLYKTAFMHGFKHGIEDAKNPVDPCEI